ncbi:MAG: hypothetical protein ACXWQO_08220 [Bdellovibrionota bacterium]
MKKSILVLAAMLISGVSHAATVTCTGGTLDYIFTIKAPVAGSRIAGNITIDVTKSGKPNNHGALPIIASKFVPNGAMSFNAKKDVDFVNVDARWDTGNNYTGSMAIGGKEGNVTVSAVCVVR